MAVAAASLFSVLAPRMLWLMLAYYFYKWLWYLVSVKNDAFDISGMINSTEDPTRILARDGMVVGSGNKHDSSC